MSETLHDLFISYASKDNKPLFESERAKGWVDEIHYSMQIRVTELLGRDARIWFDPQLRRTMPLSQILVEVSRSDLLLTVLSPSYLNSEWCAKELSEFCGREGGIRVGGRTRVLKVVKTFVERSTHPKSIRDFLSYDFYYLDVDTNKKRELKQKGGETDERYWEVFEDLCQDIAEVLQIIRSENPPPLPPLEKSVYLAEVAPDDTPMREELRREFKSLNFCVLPDRPLPAIMPDFPALVKQYLSQSRLSIHLIGEKFGPPVIGAEPESVVSMQNALAAERCHGPGFSRLIYLPKGVVPTDRRQAEFIRHLREGGAAVQGTDILETLEGLRMAALDRLRSISPAAGRPDAGARKGRKTVYLVFVKEDVSRVRPIKEYLHGLGLDIELPLLEGENERAVESHKRKLSDCDAVLYYYGTGTQEWLEQQRLYRESVASTRRAEGQPYGRSLPMDAVAFYVAAPKTLHKEEFLKHELVIKNYGDYSPADLDEFVALLEGGAAGAGAEGEVDGERA